MNNFNPVASLVNVFKYALTGCIHFPRQRVGTEFWLDGEKWIIFREVIVDPKTGQPKKPGAVFRPRFHVSGMSVRVNILFSLLPMFFIIGLPGFRSKLWLVNPNNGDFSGYYEWDTVQDAENYGNSFAAKFMTGRSVPGSVSFKIFPNE